MAGKLSSFVIATSCTKEGAFFLRSSPKVFCDVLTGAIREGHQEGNISAAFEKSAHRIQESLFEGHREQVAV